MNRRVEELAVEGSQRQSCGRSFPPPQPETRTKSSITLEEKEEKEAATPMCPVPRQKLLARHGPAPKCFCRKLPCGPVVPSS